MIVVDASAVVDALIGDEESAPLRRRMRVETLSAPDLLGYEVTSAVRRLTLTGRITVSRGLDLLVDFDDLPIRRWPADHQFRVRAFALRDVASAYDAAYLVLAESLACPLVTRDRRLARTTGHEARIELV